MSQPPKVFVSHASEDKQRFVNQFANKLLENGVDAWLDHWEILPGDSLVDKIFEEGLKEAKAIIIVLSQNSVNKPWVREELNAGVVKRIQKGTKIIPVILDDCEVPESLASTLWEPVQNVASYDEAFDRILASIFNKTLKPPIGKPPQYTTQTYQQIGELNNIDNLVLKAVYDYHIKSSDYLMQLEDVLNNDGSSSIPVQELKDSIEILEHHGYIETLQSTGSSAIKRTVFGFHEYCKSYVEDYQGLIDKCGGFIVNQEGQVNNFDIEKELKIPIVIVDNILKLLELEEYIRVSQNMSGRIQVLSASAKLKRAMQS